jgi:hypothetical protein
MVPQGEPSLGSAFVMVTPTESGLDVRGRVNPLRTGWTWVRILDRNGTPWEEDLVAVATAERIGWDANPDVVSFFQSTVPDSSGAPASGTVEIWFTADDSEDIDKRGEFAFGPEVPSAG